MGRHLLDAATASHDLRVVGERHQVLTGLLEQRYHNLETLHGATIIACNTMSPMVKPVAPTEDEEHLHALPTHIAGVVSLSVRVGTTTALATTQLWSGDVVDLHEVDLGFSPPPLSSPRMIASLVADFGAAGDAMIAIVNVVHILCSALDD